MARSRATMEPGAGALRFRAGWVESPCSEGSSESRLAVGTQTMLETSTILELTRSQILSRIERGAKQRGLPYSAEDLISAYRAGRLEDSSAVADLVGLASLLPDDDPLFVRP